MKSKLLTVKIYIAMLCIGAMAFLTGVPIMPKEKVAKILRANNQNIATEVIEAAEEQS